MDFPIQINKIRIGVLNIISKGYHVEISYKKICTLVLTVSWVNMQFVIVEYSDHNHLLFFKIVSSLANRADSVKYDIFGHWVFQWTFTVFQSTPLGGQRYSKG